MVKYYEFINHKKYALIKASNADKAIKVYFKLVLELPEESELKIVEPIEISTWDAFIMNSNYYHRGGTILTSKEAIDSFLEIKEGTLILDDSCVN